MPLFGLGVFQVRSGRRALSACSEALRVGYRHIDTAKIYGNERSVGQAVRESGIPRSDIFVTTKLWNADHGTGPARRAAELSLENLGLDYVDLYLIHWPVTGKRLETWKVLEELRDEGKIRAIGVSNYIVRHLEELLEHARIKPCVNQIELHPFNYQYRFDAVETCQKNGILVEAYSPLARGRRFDDPVLTEIADNHKKSPAQIMVRWALEHGFAVIPKSDRPERIRHNAQVFDFKLGRDDLARLDGQNEDLITGWDPTDVL